MSDPKDLDYVALAEQEARARRDRIKPEIGDAFEHGAKLGGTAMLDFAMKLCTTGMTIPMIRLQLHNKRVEISGEGEKA